MIKESDDEEVIEVLSKVELDKLIKDYLEEYKYNILKAIISIIKKNKKASNEELIDKINQNYDKNYDDKNKKIKKCNCCGMEKIKGHVKVCSHINKLCKKCCKN